MTAPEKITVLGATGSVGRNTLNVLAAHPARFSVYAITANTSTDAMLELCIQYQPEFAVMRDEEAANQLAAHVRKQQLEITVLSGEQGLETVASAPDVDRVMAAIVGGAGLKPTLAAAAAGKKILLANKEALVMAGELFLRTARENGAVILPVDSEHNAIFQSLPAEICTQGKSPLDFGILKLLLTASGGPFLNIPLEHMASVTPDEACNHPNWDMGRKISVDSATMMNKALEVIEACYLFNMSVDNVDVVIHPQSIVHSMVRYADGSVLAQMGNPDMRTPIAHVLAWPDRINAGVEPLDLFKTSLEFIRPDLDRFPCLRLGYEAARHGGTAPTVLNAANEVAVEAFLAERAGFDQIPAIIEKVIEQDWSDELGSLDDILETDQQARIAAREIVQKI
jgi:1-deoxy-D-xylulose-5-phosphate reductoisomerase